MQFFRNTFFVLGTMFITSGAMSQGTVCGDVTGGDLITEGLCTSPSGSGASKRNDKNIYMGLVWRLGQNASKTPDVLIGLRSTEVSSSNKVSGADLNLRLQSEKNFAPEAIRLSLVSGRLNSLANLGAGYSFAANQALLTGALQTSHLRAGTDYLLTNQTFAPYLEVNTLQRIKPSTSSLNCSAGTLRTVDGNFSIPGSFERDGLNTPSSELGSLLGTGPYLPIGTKTCYEVAPG